MAHTGTESYSYDDNQNIEDATPDKKIIFYKKRYEELQAEFEEYQFSSRELETELETQLSHYERRIRDLESKNAHLSNENDLLRNKLEKTTLEFNQQANSLQEKLDEVTSINEQLTNHIRELEQSNDDLERAKRHLDATLSDFDAKLNEQIERNELLESEIGEKEELQVVIQRLKDEARDLRLELMIQQNVKSKKNLSSPEDDASPNSSMVKKRSSTIPTNSNNTAALTPTEDKLSNTNNNNSVIHNNSINTLNKTSNQRPLLSASSRISALNIVSDLLRKVGALESKLASCRNIMPVSNNTRIPMNAQNGKPIESPNENHNSVNPSNTFKNINANA